jgi:hypothetical protein
MNAILKRLLWEYVRYHHEDRTHLGLGRGTPNGRIRSVFRVRSFLRSDCEASTTATIELPSPDQHSAHPYICVLHEHMVSCPTKSACSVEAMITFRPALPRNASFFVAAEVLARHTTNLESDSFT